MKGIFFFLEKWKVLYRPLSWQVKNFKMPTLPRRAPSPTKWPIFYFAIWQDAQTQLEPYFVGAYCISVHCYFATLFCGYMLCLHTNEPILFHLYNNKIILSILFKMSIKSIILYPSSKFLTFLPEYYIPFLSYENVSHVQLVCTK